MLNVDQETFRLYACFARQEQSFNDIYRKDGLWAYLSFARFSTATAIRVLLSLGFSRPSDRSKAAKNSPETLFAALTPYNIRGPDLLYSLLVQERSQILVAVGKVHGKPIRVDDQPILREIIVKV